MLFFSILKIFSKNKKGKYLVDHHITHLILLYFIFLNTIYYNKTLLNKYLIKIKLQFSDGDSCEICSALNNELIESDSNGQLTNKFFLWICFHLSMKRTSWP